MYGVSDHHINYQNFHQTNFSPYLIWFLIIYHIHLIYFQFVSSQTFTQPYSVFYVEVYPWRLFRKVAPVIRGDLWFLEKG